MTVSRGNDLIWREGFGLANIEADRAATPKTQFRVGSVSKLVTAAALMRLAEAGRIDLDAPVSTYLGLPEALGRVTLRQLAGHLAGVRHYRDGEFLSETHYARLREALAVFTSDPLVAPPGARYSYSSYGYNLIGAVLEARLNLPFSEIARREVLEPLGMRLSLIDDGGTMRSSKARGYTVGTGDPMPAPYDDLSGRWPSGGFLMTTDDMTRLGRSILAPGFLSAASLSTLLTPQRLASGEATSVGIGWRVNRDPEGRTYFHHGGSSNGGQAFLLVYPDQQLVVAMAANAFTDWGEKEALELAKIFFQEPQETGLTSTSPS